MKVKSVTFEMPEDMLNDIDNFVKEIIAKGDSMTRTRFLNSLLSKALYTKKLKKIS